MSSLTRKSSDVSGSPWVFVGVLLVLLATGCQSSRRGERSAGDVQVTGALKRASVDWDQAFNAGDAAKLANLYAPDAISMPPNAATITGQKAIQADFEGFFQATVARHETTVEVILVEGDVAIERGSYKMSFKPRAGGTETIETGRHLEIRRRIGREWRIIMEIWNMDAPAAK